ncbi:FAD binding domain-containing protein [Hirsutella rhossiliensis]|uniref:FAD binding domain-containing protein n=1 Tax=Hirsutella rhossiliensis TaxID=111463 RepID=A0A9P8MS64_9HYPO|nr:FAD binding domain-containing protein [Hirsutella rhossiliensis]KAH0960968.1 FAD binding domain-containing protein [Hirsutella rhossiliensis]
MSFKVLIIGGSIAGLTLAHCLDKLGISFDILEQGEEISPQLGLFNGFFFESQYPSVLRSRFGYPLSFLERQKFLAILYNKLDGKDRVHMGQKVVRIEDRGDRAVAITADGKEHWGHLVVGADGVHSVVRSEIWRHAKEAEPSKITDAEKSSLRVDYACIYGISSRVPGVEDGVQLSLLDQDLTIHVFNGKDQKAFWFVIVKTDKPYAYVDRPKFVPQEARKICDGLRSKKLDSALEFGAIWDKCDVFTMTPLEEGCFKTWHSGRMVCVGDAVRKMTPNIGQGANMAIEDVAVLVNALWKGNLHKAMADTAAMEDLLSIVSATRLARTQSVCKQSEFLTRLQANDGLVKRLLGRYVLPALHDIPAGSSAAVLGGKQRLAFVDLPARAAQQNPWWTFVKILSAFAPKPHVSALLGTMALAIWWVLRI